MLVFHGALHLITEPTLWRTTRLLMPIVVVLSMRVLRRPASGDGSTGGYGGACGDARSDGSDLVEGHDEWWWLEVCLVLSSWL